MPKADSPIHQVLHSFLRFAHPPPPNSLDQNPLDRSASSSSLSLRASSWASRRSDLSRSRSSRKVLSARAVSSRRPSKRPSSLCKVLALSIHSRASSEAPGTL